VARPVVAAVVRPSVVHAAAPDAYEPAARERAVARQVADPDAEPHAGHELVEVSIGAITLRVDAPAAPAAVRPLAPAPPPRQAAARARAGSGLARRALRRI
jgi:hypothetical protein